MPFAKTLLLLHLVDDMLYLIYWASFAAVVAGVAGYVFGKGFFKAKYEEFRNYTTRSSQTEETERSQEHGK